MEKGILRSQAILQRQQLSKAQFWQLNDELLIELSKFDWAKFNVVHLFLPITEKREIDTFEFINFFKSNHPDLTLVVSRCDIKSCEMASIIFDPETTVLAKNKYNIPEPIYGEEIHPEAIDAVIIPLLTFDEKGHRVGYGAGFYDRFLAKCRGDVVKVGVSLFAPTPEAIETHPQDIPLNYCITPGKTYNFG